MKNTNTVLKLRTQDQVTIFNDEICGQLSDGHWENSRPHDHWKVWCNATVEVDPNVQGRNFYASRKYNLLAKELLSVVGERIINLVKMGRAFGPENARILSDYLFNFTGQTTNQDEYSHYSKYTYTGAPKYLYEQTENENGVKSYKCNGEYYDRVRAVIEKFSSVQIKSAVEVINYTRKDMLADLREIKTAMQTSFRSLDN